MTPEQVYHLIGPEPEVHDSDSFDRWADWFVRSWSIAPWSRLTRTGPKTHGQAWWVRFNERYWSKVSINKRRKTMPIHKVSGGYKWGSKGKTYKTKAGAAKQDKAAYAHGYREKKK